MYVYIYIYIYYKTVFKTNVLKNFYRDLKIRLLATLSLRNFFEIIFNFLKIDKAIVSKWYQNLDDKLIGSVLRVLCSL